MDRFLVRLSDDKEIHMKDLVIGDKFKLDSRDSNYTYIATGLPYINECNIWTIKCEAIKDKY